jgi:flavin reductase ActVB
MIDPDLFRSVLGRFACSVTVLSARDANGKDYGMTVSAFSSVSLKPPLVLACVDKTASIYATLFVTDYVGISVLSASQKATSNRFAEKDADRFDDLPVKRGQHGVALLTDALAHLECRIMQRHDAGDHTIFLGLVEKAEAFGGFPLVYFRGGYHEISH